MRHKPNYLEDKTPKQKSQQQEKNLAKNGFVIPASGALWSFKGDVQFTDFLVEAKRTDKKGMRLTEEVLAKIFNEAIDVGKTPGMEIEFKDYYIQGVVFRKTRR